MTSTASGTRIAIAADHGGYELKADLAKLLTARGFAVTDLGTNGPEAVDYPDGAHAVAKLILAGGADFGVLVCGTGVGMAMAANRHNGVRAVNCSDTYTAHMSREHNDANVLCIGARVAGPGLAADILTTWLVTPFSGEARHARRVTKIEAG